MSSSDFSTFAKSNLAFCAIYKPPLKINEGTAYIGSSLKLRFQDRFSDMMLRLAESSPCSSALAKGWRGAPTARSDALSRAMSASPTSVLIRRIRERGNGSQDFQLESTLHQFICPMKLRGDDPTKIEQSDHDLWIIDERLTFTRYFASDVPFTQIVADEDSLRRPDLFIFDHLHGLGAKGEDPLKRVMLVEFKQPGRKDYDERYSPLNQISEYITRLKNGEIEDFQQGRVRIAEDCVFYCYVIADIVGRLDVHTSAWRTTANGRGRIHELQGKFRGIIEIIEWADLITDARLRNHAFLHAAGLRYDQHP